MKCFKKKTIAQNASMMAGKQTNRVKGRPGINGKLKSLELLPIKVCMDGNKSDNGLPFVTEDDSFMERLNDLSKPYGVTLIKKGKVYICEGTK